MKALAKRLEDRYQSAAAMRSDIERYLAGRPVQAPVPVPVRPDPARASDRPTTSTAVRPPVPPADRRGRRRPRPRGPRTGVLVLLGAARARAGRRCRVAASAATCSSRRPSRSRCPNLIGLTEDEARAAIGDAGLSVGDVDYEAERDRGQGRGHRAGPEPRPVRRPRDLGRPGRLHRAAAGRGAVPRRVHPRTRPATSSATASSSPSSRPRSPTSRRARSSRPARPAARRCTQGTTVTVSVCDGQEKVPNVVGLNRSEAEEQIRDAGFEPRGPRRRQVDRAGGHGDRPVPAPAAAAAAGTDDHHLRVDVEPPPPPPTETPTTADSHRDPDAHDAATAASDRPRSLPPARTR